MNPTTYVDLEVMASHNGGESIPIPVLASAALDVLHGVFRHHPGRYALALPDVSPGKAHGPVRILRVFAENRDDLDTLVALISGQPIIRDYTRWGYPRSVPNDFSGPWIEYRRYRIPSKKSLRKPKDTLRERRMQIAGELRFPYFHTRSRSNRQQFLLYVQALEAVDCRSVCQPDGYGLSVASRPFAVPWI